MYCGINSLSYVLSHVVLLDFIEIANIYNTVLVSNVPHLTDFLSEGTRRFIYLVDEFYDCGVKLLLTSED